MAASRPDRLRGPAGPARPGRRRGDRRRRPQPLPWPPEPVGGPRLGTCGEIGPAAVPEPIGAAAWVLADLDTGAVLAARAPHARHRPASTLKVLTALVVAAAPRSRTRWSTAPRRTCAIDGSKAGHRPGRAVHRASAAGRAAAQLRQRRGAGPGPRAGRRRGDGRGDGRRRPRARRARHPPGHPVRARRAGHGVLGLRPGAAVPGGDARPAVRRDDRHRARSPFPGYGERPGFELSNSSKLLARYPGAIGGKSGFTEAARHTLVGAAERDGRRLVVALMRGEQQPVPMWRQAAALLDWGFALPAATPALGVLVDAAPAPADRTRRRGRPGHRRARPSRCRRCPAVLAAIAAIAVAGMVIGGLALRRRRWPPHPDRDHLHPDRDSRASQRDSRTGSPRLRESRLRARESRAERTAVGVPHGRRRPGAGGRPAGPSPGRRRAVRRRAAGRAGAHHHLRVRITAGPGHRDRLLLLVLLARWPPTPSRTGRSGRRRRRRPADRGTSRTPRRSATPSRCAR